MDILCGTDPKLGDMDEPDMTDFLDSDMFSSSMTPDNYVDNDWLNCFFDDPVLNDKMITDAAQPPCIKSEHSYSLNDQPGSPLGLSKIDDIDADFLTSPVAMDLSQKSYPSSTSPESIIKQEAIDTDPLLTSAPSTTTSATKQPTIILAPSMSQMTTDQPVFPQITVKQEPMDSYDANEAHEAAVTLDQIILPPTPPSSASSDSEGSQSPQRSAPSSPIHSSSGRSNHHISISAAKAALSQPLFVNPIPQSGVLILSEEEKRTLVAEGYPIPGKLPLTKQEEKNLKKIRRKIKNKISAQESRRKKKEYLEALEKRVESFNQENSELKKKVDSLENNNRSLLGQLHKLQALVSKMPRPSSASATQTGTVLMVLVLCFAVFLGSWSPTSLNIGYSSGVPATIGPVFLSKPDYVRPTPDAAPSVVTANVQAGDYATPNMKSRMLLSVKDEQDDLVGEDIRVFYTWDKPWCSSSQQHEDDETVADIRPFVNDVTPEGHEVTEGVDMPVLPKSDVKFSPANETLENADEYQAMMHPDIAATPVDIRSIDTRGNQTVEIETA